MRYLVFFCLCLAATSALAQSVGEMNDSLRVAFGNQDWEQAEKWVARMMEAEPERSSHVFNMVCVKSLQEEIDQALDYLERLIASGSTNVGQIESDSDLDNIRETERYQRMVGDMKTRFESYRLPAGEQLLTVEIPVLMECYAVMLYLGNPEHTLITTRKDHPYLGKIDAYFADYKEHPLVAQLAEMHPGEPWVNNLRAHHNLRTLCFYDGLDTSKIISYPVEIRPALAGMVKRFAEESDFETFYEENRPFYEAMKRIVQSNYAFGANIVDFFNENFEERFSRFSIYFTPLWGGWQHGPSIEWNDYRECFYFGGCLYSVNSEFFYPDQLLQFLIVTEFDHASINPITHGFMIELEQHNDKLPLLNTNEESNYGYLEGTLNEYLTWAFALQFYYEHAPDQYPSLKDMVVRIMNRRDFSRFEEFMGFYEGYITDRETYPMLEDFYPEIINWLAQLDPAGK